MYKWLEHQIAAEFRYHNVIPNLNKVRKFQVHTDDLSECVKFCVTSMRNDRDEAERRLSHDTGAVA